MLQIKEGYILRPFLDKWVAVYVGEGEEHPPMFTMNKTGAFLWERLQTPTTREQLLQAMLDRYEVTEELADQQLNQFLSKLKEKEILEEIS